MTFRFSVGAVVVAGALASVLTLAARPARAWVRYLSESGCPYSWRSRSIALIAYPRPIADLTTEQETVAISGAVDAWTSRNAALAGCTDLDLKLTVKGPNDVAPTARYDHHNIIAFRTDSWCAAKDNGAPDPGCSDPHDPSALAITSVFARAYGEIVDADIEVNAVNFVWGDLVTAPDQARQDLQNALTHEAGHFIGLDHTCFMVPTLMPPKDENGVEIPACASAPADVRATTMFASAQPGDVSKRTLEADDRAAVCATYPAGAKDTLACPAPDSGGGCAVTPIPVNTVAGASPLRWTLGGAGGLLLALTVWLGARRRNGRRDP